MAKLNNVEIHFKHSNRTYNTMTAFLVMWLTWFQSVHNTQVPLYSPAPCGYCVGNKVVMQAYQLYNCHVNQMHYQYIEAEKNKK